MSNSPLMRVDRVYSDHDDHRPAGTAASARAPVRHPASRGGRDGHQHELPVGPDSRTPDMLRPYPRQTPPPTYYRVGQTEVSLMTSRRPSRSRGRRTLKRRGGGSSWLTSRATVSNKTTLVHEPHDRPRLLEHVSIGRRASRAQGDSCGARTVADQCACCCPRPGGDTLLMP